MEAIAIRLEAIATSSKDATRWRPSLLGWRPSLLGTRSYWGLLALLLRARTRGSWHRYWKQEATGSTSANAAKAFSTRLPASERRALPRSVGLRTAPAAPVGFPVEAPLGLHEGLLEPKAEHFPKLGQLGTRVLECSWVFHWVVYLFNSCIVSLGL